MQDLILGSMQEGVLLFDGGGRDRVRQRRARAPPRRAARRQSPSSIPPDLREAVRGAGDRTDGSSTVEVERGEPTRWLRATAAPAGSEGSVLLVVTDVTETRRIEAVRRDFVANASHELKTPAASIQAAAETLRLGGRRAIPPPSRGSPPSSSGRRCACPASSPTCSTCRDWNRAASSAEPVRLDALVREEAERFEERRREAGLSRSTIDAPQRRPRSPVRRATSRCWCATCRQRDPIHAARRPHHGDRGAEAATVARARVRRRRRGHPDAGPAPGLRALLPGRSRAFPRDRRHRLGLAIVKHVAENHGGTRRGRERARARARRSRCGSRPPVLGRA